VKLVKKKKEKYCEFDDLVRPVNKFDPFKLCLNDKLYHIEEKIDSSDKSNKKLKFKLIEHRIDGLSRDDETTVEISTNHDYYSFTDGINKEDDRLFLSVDEAIQDKINASVKEFKKTRKNIKRKHFITSIFIN
jgi:hypothetical protein